MRKNLNTVHIEGRVYQHSLEIKKVKNQSSANFGKPYIGGTLEVATDEEGLNIIPVEFTFVTEFTKQGKANRTYAALKTIIDTGKTWIADGPEAATKVSIDTAFALNDFVAKDGNMVSLKELNGGFVSVVNALKPNVKERNRFKLDVLITNTAIIEADPEKHIDEEYMAVRGAAFDFKNALLPIDFVVRSEDVKKHFESFDDLSAAQPLYTQVYGTLNYKKVTYTEEVETFGEAIVDTHERKVREWEITAGTKVPYDFGDESVMTPEEVMKASQDRQIYLAEKKRQKEEYLEQKNTNAGANSFMSAITNNDSAIPTAPFKF